MSLALPCFTIDTSGSSPRVRAPRGGLFRPGELTEFTSVERGEPAWPVERFVPLAGGRWAAGRREGPVDVWRLVDETTLPRVGHPAWLWTSTHWLDPAHADEEEVGSVPAHHPLRALLKRAAVAADTRRKLVKAIGGIVASLRARKAVAVVVEADALRHPTQPVQALALAMVTILPPAWRLALRMSVGEVDVHAGDIYYAPDAASPAVASASAETSTLTASLAPAAIAAMAKPPV